MVRSSPLCKHLAFDDEPAGPISLRPEDEQVGATATETVLALDAAAAVDDALQECLQEKLRTRLLVVEPGHPVLRMLPEECLEGGQ